jgi:hypothetical protein
MVLAIKIDARNATLMLERLNKRIPQAAQEGLRELADLAVQNLKTSAYNAGIKHWGKGKERSIFRGGIHKRKTKTGYDIIMSRHGVYLDSMRSHWVALKRGREITRWALDRGIAIPRGRGYRPVATIYPVGLTKVYVRKHPFIHDAFIKTVKKVKIVEKKINKTIRSKGRR